MSLFYQLAVILLFCGCTQTPKVEILQEQPKENEKEVVEKTNEEIQLVEEETQMPDSSANVNSSNENVVDKVEEKKKEEEKTQSKIIEEPEIPETDTYNPKADPAPNEFVLVEKEAKPKNLDAIKEDISQECRLRGIKGFATVGILVSTHGNHLKHYFFGVSNKPLETVISERIHKVKFTPAISNGQPVKMWYKTRIEVK